MRRRDPKHVLREIMGEIEGEQRNQNKNRQGKPGPKTCFFHYIKDLNMDVEEAIQKVLKDFPVYNEEIVRSWYEEAQKNERDNKDEGR